ncbi:hypothetical protein F8388_009328 [Cannabis sativa]|uniref:AAA+ ATPase domain-containing protein n=1 Tax=Cannabis sativa TaxID=3483 RepID=A0A7J6GKA7_CANSA|nr:hypothetical protein F8388_009328 [Cannabis sativa]
MADSSSSSSSETNLTTAKTFLSTAASVAATAMLVRTLVNDFMPDEFQDLLFSGIRNFFNRFSSQMTMVLDEFDGLVNNQIYEAAEVYLGGKVSPSTQRLKVSKPEKEKNFTIAMERGETIVDFFNGVKFTWILVCRQVESKNFHNPRDLNSTLRSEVRSFELSFHKRNLDLVLNSYLPHILAESKSAKQEKKTLKIFTVDYENIYCNIADAWMPTNLDHPATFETLALDSEIKNFILNDLEKFVRRKDYYRKVGKAWKRGYLLYGPPGTGKSSLIAAMANYLNFDVYDLELSELQVNSDLRKLLIAMANRSILVVEDIDCSVNFEDRNKTVAESSSTSPNGSTEKKVTLSGLLNFIDGLWSSCGDERIIIFTTNHKERLDPALLRPGRMDVHVHMSYCTPGGFKLLASNYLGIKHHPLFEEIEQQLESAEVTPAEVAEELIKSDDPEVALKGLVGFLKVKKKESEEAKLKKEKDEEEKKGISGKKDSEAKELENGKVVKGEEGDLSEELVKGGQLEVALQGIVDLLKVRKKVVKKEKPREDACKENGKANDVESDEESKTPFFFRNLHTSLLISSSSSSYIYNGKHVLQFIHYSLSVFSSMAETNNMAKAKMLFSTAASMAATAMVVRSFMNDFLPHQFHDLLFSRIGNFFNRFSSQMTMVIEEFDGFVNNEIYEAAEVYLSEKISPSTQRLKVSKPVKEKNFTIAMERGETIVDFFNGIKFTWVLVCSQSESQNFNYMNSTIRSEVRWFELKFHKKHLNLVLKSYLPQIIAESKLAKQDKKTLKIFTIENTYANLADIWMPTNLDHPSNFETLALDLETKNFIINDLQKFLKRKDYYRKVGKAWKRGYLLYGPPGTGKSSLIASMANYLNFDVYDLELSKLNCDSELRRALIAMANRSILVIEDIDCSVNFEDRNKAAVTESEENKVTLSGLLNFIDGLWSCCGDERIIIFTTNHKERLDPALVRPGRMDVHIHMSYCTPDGFKLLASNYLGIKHHVLFEEIERQLEPTEVTPAEVAEVLMKSDNNPQVALEGVIEFLNVKRKENEEAKLKKEKEEGK